MEYSIFSDNEIFSIVALNFISSLIILKIANDLKIKWLIFFAVLFFKELTL